jgi:hypothetical protein
MRDRLATACMIVIRPVPSGREAHGEQNTNATQHDRDSDHTQSGASQRAVITEVSSPHQGEIAPELESETPWYMSPHWWIARFTAALFVSTTGLWAFTWLLWSTTKRGMGELERPWIHIVPISNNLRPFWNEIAQANRPIGVEIEIKFQFVNYGKIPAVLTGWPALLHRKPGTSAHSGRSGV